MKRVNLNLYESHLPPRKTNVLWADVDRSTGDIRAVHRYKAGNWEPYLVSVDYLKPDKN